jgi:hypothetical protein
MGSNPQRGTGRIGFNESLHPWKPRHIWHGNDGRVLLDQLVRPVPPAPHPDGSLTGWIWLTVVLALVLAAGMIVSSRR